MGERNLDFDRVIDRKGTRSLKYDFAKKRGMPEDVLPLWVADMDFETSSYIEDALIERTRHGIFGYSEVQEPYFEILKEWMKRHYGWDIREEWLLKTPGIVVALALAVKAYTEPGDGVLIQLPVYYPFSEVIVDNKRRVVSNTLYLGEDNRYHADFVFKGRHQVFAGLKKEFEDISITCTSPSKTFNIAGLSISNIFIANKELRQRFKKQMDAAGISQLGIMGLVACEAAYSKSEEWYQAMYAYVKENIAFVKSFVEEKLEGVNMTEHEGTYLVWLDFRKTGLTVEELEHLVIQKARLWLDSGKIFGDSGRGFWRINVACPRSVLTEALERIRAALTE